VRESAGEADSAFMAYRELMEDAALAGDEYAGLVDTHGGTVPPPIDVPPSTDAYKASTVLGDPVAPAVFADAPMADDGGTPGGDPTGDLFTFDGGEPDAGDAFDLDPTFEHGGGVGDGVFDCDPSGLETCV
jgi:hypothetical protein